MSDNAPSIDLLLEELCEVVEWYTLGAYLGLTENEIKEIEQDHRETARRRMAMLSKWIKKKSESVLAGNHCRSRKNVGIKPG